MASAEGRQATADLVVRKSVVVGLPIERAFTLFTERASDWWPFATHSVQGERAVEAVFEPRPGGRVYERSAAGAEAEWGRVVTWEPPHRFVLAWLVDPRCAGELIVAFAPEDRDTRVDLEHRGWEQYGDEAEAMMTGYASGWEHVLRQYAGALDAP